MNAQKNLTVAALSAVVLAACGAEQPVRTVSEFIENPMLLEAAMVRCAQDRTKSRYEPECINAREAVKLIEAKEEQARREAAEARSESKRQALRRAQEAAAEARRRAAETERLRKEAEYLAQFGVALPEDAEVPTDDVDTGGNLPGAVIPQSTTPQQPPSTVVNPATATDGGNAPIAVQSDDDGDGTGENDNN